MTFSPEFRKPAVSRASMDARYLDAELIELIERDGESASLWPYTDAFTNLFVEICGEIPLEGVNRAWLAKQIKLAEAV